MTGWTYSSTGTSALSTGRPESKQGGAASSRENFLVSAERTPIVGVSGARYLASLRHKAGNAVGETLATVPEAIAILWSTVDDAIHVVTILCDRTDDVILRVAEQEMALMDKMREYGFEFRTAHVTDYEAYVADGYVPIIENGDDDNSSRT